MEHRTNSNIRAVILVWFLVFSGKTHYSLFHSLQVVLLHSFSTSDFQPKSTFLLPMSIVYMVARMDVTCHAMHLNQFNTNCKQVYFMLGSFFFLLLFQCTHEFPFIVIMWCI